MLNSNLPSYNKFYLKIFHNILCTCVYAYIYTKDYMKREFWSIIIKSSTHGPIPRSITRILINPFESTFALFPLSQPQVTFILNFVYRPHAFKNVFTALYGWLSWLEYCLIHQKIMGLIPGGSTYRRQPIDISLCLSVSLSLSLSLNEWTCPWVRVKKIFLPHRHVALNNILFSFVCF